MGTPGWQESGWGYRDRPGRTGKVGCTDGEPDSFPALRRFHDEIRRDVTTSICIEMCQYLEGFHSAVSPYFPNDHCIVS